MFDRYHIERDEKQQKQMGEIFNQMTSILNHYAPQEEKISMKNGLPMVSVDQAAQELLAMLKNS